VLSGCGAQSDGRSADGASAEKLTIGAVRAANAWPEYLGVRAGLYADHGLDVTVKDFKDGPSVLAAVVSGDIDYGTTHGIGTVSGALANGACLKVTGADSLNQIDFWARTDL